MPVAVIIAYREGLSGHSGSLSVFPEGGAGCREVEGEMGEKPLSCFQVVHTPLRAGLQRTQ